MARKARQKISYVLPLTDSAHGHRLGVNGLAIDQSRAILYSGGRDGVIYAWDTHLNLDPTRTPSSLPRSRANSLSLHGPQTSVRQSVQAHTHWINDIVLANYDEAVVSASSDIAVKVWRPTAHDDNAGPETIGLHSDYVKVLAVPSAGSDWVASGGLDRCICLWDLSGAGPKLNISVTEEDGSGLAREKGSIYALDTTQTVLAAGGPEGAVRVVDPRSAKPIIRFVGHTDNIRDILVSQDGSTIISAGSDQTVRIWDMSARRCLTTLTMHDASVWSLFSSDLNLRSFFSCDKSGLVVKTDMRTANGSDNALSVALCQQHTGVSRLVAAGDYFWTASSSPSINRWIDVDLTNAEPEVPVELPRHQRFGSAASRTRMTSFSQPRTPPQYSKRQVPLQHILQSNSGVFFQPVFSDPTRSMSSLNKRATTVQHSPIATRSVEPLRSQPDSTIAGRNGLVKHVMLNDKRRVLTLDAAGQVMLWDLLQCKLLQSFGKRQLGDVQAEFNSEESAANWCSVDTRIGALAVTLEENTCFDAETYYDELDLDETPNIREDMRVNLGKWVLRYLFAGFIAEEIVRDRMYRRQLHDAAVRDSGRLNKPDNIQIPGSLESSDWPISPISPQSPTTPATPYTPYHMRIPATPGLGIMPATPVGSRPPGIPYDSTTVAPISPHAEPLMAAGKDDYFSMSSSRPGSQPQTSGQATTLGADVALPSPTSEVPKSPVADGAGESAGKFSKRFRMNVAFKKLGRGSSLDKERTSSELPSRAVEDMREAEVLDDSTTTAVSTEPAAPENLFATIQTIRAEYDEIVQKSNRDSSKATSSRFRPLATRSFVAPPMPPETPLLRLPLDTTILIQEDRPEASGVADLFKGTVGGLAEHVDQIERAAPRWLGELLLRNQMPLKEAAKVSFVLEPWKGLLPAVGTSENNRLNANRMLRARKVLAYIVERIYPDTQIPGAAPPNGHENGETGQRHANGDADDSRTSDNGGGVAVGIGIGTATDDRVHGVPMRAEEYLELWCNDQLVPAKMTLATVRTRFWRGAGDVVMYYKERERGHGVGHVAGRDQEREDGTDGDRK